MATFENTDAVFVGDIYECYIRFERKKKTKCEFIDGSQMIHWGYFNTEFRNKFITKIKLSSKNEENKRKRGIDYVNRKSMKEHWTKIKTMSLIG